MAVAKISSRERLLKYALTGPLSIALSPRAAKMNRNASRMREGGGPKRLYKDPTDFTKPKKDYIYTKTQQTIESPDRLYKDIKRLCKDPKHYTKPSKY